MGGDWHEDTRLHPTNQRVSVNQEARMLLGGPTQRDAERTEAMKVVSNKEIPRRQTIFDRP